MTRQLRRQWKKRTEKELLGSQPRENFDQKTLELVDATTALWTKLAQRGWTPIEGGIEFMWEFKLGEANEDPSLHYWCTPTISGGYTPYLASVVLTGDINEPEPGEEPTPERECTFDELGRVSQLRVWLGMPFWAGD